MTNRTLLTTTALLSAVLFVVHLTDDIVLGLEQGDINDMRGGTAIALVWLCGILLGSERRWGHAIMLVGGILSVAVAYLHFSGRGVARFADTPAGPRFIATLLFLSVSGALTVVLVLRGLWQRRASATPATSGTGSSP